MNININKKKKKSNKRWAAVVLYFTEHGTNKIG